MELPRARGDTQAVRPDLGEELRLRGFHWDTYNCGSHGHGGEQDVVNTVLRGVAVSGSSAT